MADTSISLLDHLQQNPNDAAWHRMVELYTPLIHSWLARYSLLDQDVEDLVQDVLAVVVRKFPDFKREPRTGAFRRWMRNITVNCLREFWRAQRFRPRATGDSGFAQVLEQLEDPESSLSKLWDQE